MPHSLRPRRPLSGHRLRPLGMLSGEVPRLGSIDRDIVQLPLLYQFIPDDLPLPLTVRPVAGPLPGEVVGLRPGLALEDGDEAPSLDWKDPVALVGLGVFSAGHLEARGHQVDDVPDLPDDRPGLDVAGPAHDEGGTDAPLVDPALVPAEGGVLCPAPRGTDRDVIVPRAGIPLLRVAPAGLLGTSAVVGEEHDDRILIDFKIAQRLHESADILVHRIDHGGVDGHTQVLELLVRRSPAVGARVGVGDRPHLRVDEPHFDLPCVALLAHLVPAHAEFPDVLLDVLGFGMQRVVGGGVGDVQEERLLLRRELPGAGDGMVGEGVGGVVVLREFLDDLVIPAESPDPAALVLRVGLRRVEEVAAAVEKPVVLVEPALERVGGLAPAKVPFPAEGGAIAGAAKGLAERDHIGAEESALAPAGVEAGDDRRPRRGALGIVVELGEPGALLRQCVDVRGPDFAAITADVRPPHVVAHDEDDIGLIRDGVAGDNQGQHSDQQGEHAHDIFS